MRQFSIGPRMTSKVLQSLAYGAPPNTLQLVRQACRSCSGHRSDTGSSVAFGNLF